MIEVDKSNHIDLLIERCITALCKGNYGKAARLVKKLATAFAECGFNLKSFLDMRMYIIQSAIKNSDKEDIEENFINHEKQLAKESKCQH